MTTQPEYDPNDDINANGVIDEQDVKAIVDQSVPDNQMAWWKWLLTPWGAASWINLMAERDEFFATVSALEEKYGITLEPYAQALYEAEDREAVAKQNLADIEAAGPEGAAAPFGDPAQQANAVADAAPLTVDPGTARTFGPGRPLGVTEGMLELGVIREQLADDGSIVYQSVASGSPMLYAEGNAMAMLEAFAPDQLAAFRQAAYITGYEPDPTLTATVNEKDVAAMTEIMADANIAGLSWAELLNRNAATGMRQTFGEFNDWRMRQDFSNAGEKLNQYALDNGVVLSGQLLQDLASSLASGAIDETDAFQFIKEQYVKRLYPNWAREVDMGLTIKDIAAPMIQYASDRLGVSPDQINVFDPAVQQFLTEVEPEGQLSKTGFNRMNDIVENHPYWQYSPDAAQKLGAIQRQIMQEFGFGTDPSFRPPQGYGAFGGLSGFGAQPGLTGFSGGSGTGMPTWGSPATTGQYRSDQEARMEQWVQENQ